MISGATAAKLRTIRSAGLGRVRDAAKRQGIATVERDMKILRDTAHGSTVRAAELAGVHRKTVDDVLARYEGIARAILRRDEVRRPRTWEVTVFGDKQNTAVSYLVQGPNQSAAVQAALLRHRQHGFSSTRIKSILEVTDND